MAEENNQAVDLEFYARPEYLADVRKLVERLATRLGMSRDERDDFITAVDEATANAIRHGSPNGEKDRVRVVCHPLNDALIVEVRDQGGGFSVPSSASMPVATATGGRGLPLMAALADSVEISSTPKGTVVALKKLIDTQRMA